MAIITPVERAALQMQAEIVQLQAERGRMRDAIKGALPWLILLGDHIGNGTQDDPMGRCDAILALRRAIGEFQ
jgi:hypothetical protein